MTRRNTRANRITVVLTAALLMASQLFCAAACFADEGNTDSLRTTPIRDGMFLGVPGDWQVAETGSREEDIAQIEAGEPVFEIMELTDENDVEQAEMWVCADVSTWDNYYCDTKEEAEAYYENTGYEVVTQITDAALGGADPTPEYTCMKGEDRYTYTVRQKVQAGSKDYLVYLSCEYTSNGVLHMAMIFEPTVDPELADRIGCSMEGFTYAVDLTENSDVEPPTQWGGDDDNYGDLETWRDRLFDAEELIQLLITGLIWLAAIIFAFRLLKRLLSDRKSRGGIASDKWVFKEARNGNRSARAADTPEDALVHEGGRYAGYRESLKTLHKSGLLTTKEMNELLEKHKNDL